VALTEDTRRDTLTEEPPQTREVRLLSDTPVGDDAHDVLGFGPLAEVLSELIDSERTDTPLTLAISAPWGAGKTTMARLIECRLARLTAQRNGQRPAVICWFNAWQHNDAPHLGAALAAAVAHETDRLRPLWRRVLNPLPPSMISPRARVRRALILGLTALAVVAAAMLVNSIRDAVTSASVAEDDAAKLGPLIVTGLAGLVLWRRVFAAAESAARFIDQPTTAAALGSMSAVREELGDLIAQATRGGRLVIFIDDLERCSPERALEVCEVTSQLLAQEGVITVLIADMARIARSAGARYSGEHDEARNDAEAGRQFLEKLVQIQITLPPARPADLDRLLLPATEDPATGPTEDAACAEDAVRPKRGRFSAALVSLGWKPVLWWLLLFGAVVLGYTIAGVDDISEFMSVVLVVLLPFVAISIGIYSTAVRLLDRYRTRKRLDAIKDAIHKVASSPGTEDLEASVLEQVGQVRGPRRKQVSDLVHQEVRSYLIHESEPLKEVEDYIRLFPPELPRGAKRVLNHARVLTRVALDRHVLDGGEVTPQHLGKWIVVSERWVDVAAYVKAKPATLRRLEHDAQAETLGDSYEQFYTHGLAEVLRQEPPLSDVVERLIRYEPGTPAA
jgi:hypothetical protein